MSDTRFGGPAATGPGDPYGFFAPPAAASAAQAAPFGTPAATPFGTSSPYATNPYGSPTARPAARRRLAPVAGVFLVLLVAVGGWYGWRVWQHNQPVHVPATLGGLPQATDPRLTAAASQMQTELQQENPGIKLEVRAYGDSGSTTAHILFAGAARGRTDVHKDFASVGDRLGAVRTVGSSTCASSPQVGITVCERSDGDLTVIALSLRRGSADDPIIVAGLVDEVWRQT